MSTAPLHDDRLSFASLTPNNVGTVRKLHSTIIPVKYSDSFYRNILSPEVEDFCKLGIRIPTFYKPKDP